MTETRGTGMATTKIELARQIADFPTAHTTAEGFARRYTRPELQALLAAFQETDPRKARRLFDAAEWSKYARAHKEVDQSVILREGVILNKTITHVTDYDGHWRGEAFITHHTYGEQVHRTRPDAERWNEQQRKLRPVS